MLNARARARAHTLSLSLIVALIYDVYYTICLSFVCLYVTCVIIKIV
jgi:hypothetical protein